MITNVTTSKSMEGHWISYFLLQTAQKFLLLELWQLFVTNIKEFHNGVTLAHTLLVLYIQRNATLIKLPQSPV